MGVSIFPWRVCRQPRRARVSGSSCRIWKGLCMIPKGKERQHDPSKIILSIFCYAARNAFVRYFWGWMNPDRKLKNPILTQQHPILHLRPTRSSTTRRATASAVAPICPSHPKTSQPAQPNLIPHIHPTRNTSQLKQGGYKITRYAPPIHSPVPSSQSHRPLSSVFRPPSTVHRLPSTVSQSHRPPSTILPSPVPKTPTYRGKQ